MGNQSETSDFFTAGGTLHSGAPSYVKRAADEQLFQALRTGQLCYVLTTRQMGKSSLMIRTAARLQQEGICTAIVDLSKLGVQASAEQWYFGILKELVDQLQLTTILETWWRTHRALGVVQRFADFVNDVVLVELSERIVIFFDEIDSTLKLDFTDDFFAAIRVMYNLRASDPAYDRLTFALLGVASPASLIKDRRRTPFNIGQAIDLPDFSRSDAQPLLRGLEHLFAEQGSLLLDRIFYWTGGHPYLTQKICVAMANGVTESNEPAAVGSEGDSLPAIKRVDRCVYELFLRADAKSEENLQFVHSRIRASPERRALLQLYRRIWKGESVGEDERSLRHNELKLAGLVGSQQGTLCVRNEIYRRVFDLTWIKKNLPFEQANLVTLGALAVIALTLIGFFVYQQIRQDQVVRLLSSGFRQTNIADERLAYLARLCEIRPNTGRDEFFALEPDAQRNMFAYLSVGHADDDNNLPVVVGCLQPGLATRSPEERPELSTAICQTMQKYCAIQDPPRVPTGDLCLCASEESQ